MIVVFRNGDRVSPAISLHLAYEDFKDRLGKVDYTPNPFDAQAWFLHSLAEVGLEFTFLEDASLPVYLTLSPHYRDLVPERIRAFGEGDDVYIVDLMDGTPCQNSVFRIQRFAANAKDDRWISVHAAA